MATGEANMQLQMLGMNVFVLGLVMLCGEVYLVPSAESCAAGSSAEATCPQGQHLPEVAQSLLQTQSRKSSLSLHGRKAKDVLPQHLHDVGVQVFQSEEGLDKAVSESVPLSITYAGVPINLRILAKDNAAQRLGDKDEDGKEYGLDTLLEARASSDDMINMIDMGGNYGAVSIAVFNKFQGLVRAVLVEPVAPTYFFLRWNLWLNNVPDVSREDFVKDPSKPGVVPLFGGVTENPGQDLLMCAHPEWSMNAYVVDKFDEGYGCDCRYMNCTKVPGINAEHLFKDYFDNAPITLMKMDCEGCEFHTLPVLAKDPSRVKRLVGELHMPEEHLIDTACQYDNGMYMTKVCRLEEKKWGSSLALECNQERKVCKW